MKSIKLILSGLLILISITISGDLFQDYLRHFEYTFDHTSFTLPFKVNDKEMTSELLKEAKKNDIRFFTVKRKSNGIYEENLCIYFSEPSVMEEIEKQCNIRIQTYNSMFFGKTIVCSELFEQSSDKLLSGTYYLLGNEDNMFNFKMALIDKYGGGLISDGYDPRDDGLFVVLIWTTVLVMFILLSLFEYSIQQKENALLISMGKNPNFIIVKNVIIDSSTIILCYLLGFVIMSNITCPFFYQSFHILTIMLIVISDVLVYSKLYKLQVQKVFKGNINKKGLLRSCYIAKFVSTALTMALIASNLIVINEAVAWKSQKDYWEKYYSYNQLSARFVGTDTDNNANDEIDLKINYDAYSYFFNKADATLMAYVAGEDFFGKDVIAYNRNSLNYLSESIASVDFSNFKDNRVYALLPEKYYAQNFNKSQKEELEHMANYLMDWDGSYTEGVEIVYYTDSVKLLALNSNFDFESNYYKNPIILFVNIDEERNPRINTGDDNIGSNSYFTMYDITPDEFEQFFETLCPSGYSVQLFSSNVGEQYEYKLGVAEKTLYINSFLTILLVILNFLISLVTIRLDYSVNAVELSIKKILGFSLFERQKKMFVGSAVCFVTSYITAIIICMILQLTAIYYVTLFGFLFLLFDLITIIFVTQKTERNRTIKTLKGGAL